MKEERGRKVDVSASPHERAEGEGSERTMLACEFPGTSAAPSICESCVTSVLKPVMA